MLLNDLYICEQAENTVAIIFGRFNPAHQGHKAAWQAAAQYPNWYVGTNKSTQGPKDPLPFPVKIEVMKTIWPEIEGHLVAEQSWWTLATYVYKKHGEVNLVVVTDEDDAKVFVPGLRKSNGVEGRHGYYKFTSIEWQQSPRLSSATSLRAAVRADDREAFAQAAGVPADTIVAGQPFFDLVAHYLNQYPVKEGILDVFKRKPSPTKAPREAITSEERAMISKIFPQNNANIKWSQAGDYVLPDSVKANYGVGILSFYKRGGQLKISVAWHRSEADRADRRAIPLAHLDYEVNSIQDLVKIKEMLDGGKLTENWGNKLSSVAGSRKKLVYRPAEDVEESISRTLVGELPVDSFSAGDMVYHQFLPKGGTVLRVDSSSVYVKSRTDGKIYRMSPHSLSIRPVHEDAAGVGVIASKKQARDPRYSMSLTKDVRPGATERNLKKLRLK